jgi:hypothetical protein
MKRTWLVACCLLLPPRASGLAQSRGGTSAAPDSLLRVFFDCPGFAAGCDFDFLRTEIQFVDWVRNREDASVHVLVTTQTTGGLGQDYTITFIGRRDFIGRTDTLHYVANATTTSDDARHGLAQALKIGLLPFVAGTPLARLIDISYTAAPQSPSAVRDPWHDWVFRISVNGNYSAEKTSNYFSIYDNVSASRTTEAWKLNLSMGASYTESNYHYREDSVTAYTFSSVQRNYNAQTQVIRSLGAHWSAGVRGSVSQSTFLNQDYSLQIAPAAEYNIFPYDQSTRRYLSLQYAVGARRFDYGDTTIYDRLAETLPVQTLTLTLSSTQPWGSTAVSAEGSAFLRHGTLNKNHLTFFGNAQIRLIKGLNINFFGSASLIHDQLFLSKAGVDQATLLLRRRQLETSFQYETYVGLSYRFGSIHNNVVNPRFEGGGSGMIIFN